MEFLADTHIHVYPEHQPDQLLDAAGRHLRQWAQTDNSDLGLFFVEASGYHYFDEWREKSSNCPRSVRIETSSDPCTLQINRMSPSFGAEESMWCFSGRQIVTAERLEILGLVMDKPVEDGLPAADVIRRVLDCGGIPVLAWGLGKWLFGRAHVVRDLLDQFDPDHLWIGDNALRPWGWMASHPLRSPTRRVLAGSDPLPMIGEECMAGTYGTRMVGEIDSNNPSESARQLLRSPPAAIQRIGRRNHPIATGRRMWRYHQKASKASG